MYISIGEFRDFFVFLVIMQSAVASFLGPQ